MAFEIEFTESAADHVRALRKHDQRTVLDALKDIEVNPPDDSENDEFSSL
jgi:hypothetical protein